MRLVVDVRAVSEFDEEDAQAVENLSAEGISERITQAKTNIKSALGQGEDVTYTKLDVYIEGEA